MELECERLEAAVDDFAFSMKKRLRKKLAEGLRGWDELENKADIEEKMQSCEAELHRGDTARVVDVANLAMFLYRLTQ